MPILEAGYVNKQTAVEISAWLTNGWSRKSKGYAYSEQLFLDFPGDIKIRIEVSVFPRPGGFQESLSNVPPLADCRGSTEGIDYQLANGRLSLLVQLMRDGSDFNPLLPWILTSGSKNHAIRWTERSIAAQANTSVELQLLMVFRPPPAHKPADVKDWESKFLPGGLPSLGKRR